MDILIRDVPAEVHAELSRRAATKDVSLRAYLHQVLTDHLATPSMVDWLDHVRDLRPVDPDGPAGAELVAAGRAEDDELSGR